MITPQRNILTRREEEIGKYALSITDLMIPIFSLVTLLFMTVFVYIPTLQDATNVKIELDTTKEKITKIADLKTKLAVFNINQLNTDYDLITKMVPYRLEVADFAYYVDQLAKQKNLKLNQISASSQKVTTESLSTPAGQLYGVNGPLKYEGTYDDIMSFFNEFNTYSPYLVNVSDISMSSSTDGKWTLEMNVTGFYIQQSDAISFSNMIYGPFKSYIADPLLIEALRLRGQKLLGE